MSSVKKRKDIHRPSAIKPEEYQFVAILINEQRADLDFGELDFLRIEKDHLRQHMEQTGGRFSMHEHGGSCHVCGAWALDLAVYYHKKTNRYIEVGLDCSEKLLEGDAELFRAWRKERQDAKKQLTRKKEAEERAKAAEQYLIDNGYKRAVEIAKEDNPNDISQRDIISDLVRNAKYWGNLTEAQWKFMDKLLGELPEVENRLKKQADIEANAEPAPEGRVTVTGEILGTRMDETPYGVQEKMLVQDDRGFKVWGTIPKAIDDCGKGCRVQFDATLTQGQDDPYFALSKRPTKAKFLE